MHVHTEQYAADKNTERLGGTSTPAVIVLVHGAGDHCGRYRHVIEKITSRGISVVTGDLPGHGRSGGLAGHVDSFDEYLDCVEQWVQQAEQMAPGGRIALLGHSMGGLVVVRYLQERATLHPLISAAVLSSPCLRLAMQVPAWKRTMAEWLNRLLPKLRLPSGIDPASVSRSLDVVEAYRQDPSCGGKVSARWYQELNRAMQLAKEQVGRVAVPVLLMQAGQDKIVDASQAAAFFAGLAMAKDSKLVPYPECYHELFNEPEQEQVFAEMIGWLERKVVPWS